MLVKSHIGSLDRENARRDWLRWALRMDGPLYFENPTPYHSTSDRADPAYIVSLISITGYKRNYLNFASTHADA